MNATAFIPRGLRPATLPLVLGLLLFSGCLEKHFVWSPDGSRAAVIARDGLHLCDAEGRLSPLLLPDVYLAAWLGDSQQLVVAQSRPVGDWASIARALGPEHAASIAAESEGLWQKLEAGGQWGILIQDLGGKKTAELLKIYLRDRHGEVLRAKVGQGDWDGIQALHADLTDLAVARIAGDRVQAGPALHEGLEKVEDLRVAPGDRAVAFTTDQSIDNDKECRLWVAPLAGAGAATVAEHTAVFPDWSPDGRSVAYIQASGDAQPDLRLATLVRREVLGADGALRVAEKGEDLAGLMFGYLARVRCLRDGRILFNAPEFDLPIAAKDAEVEREELWAWDGARQSTLVRLTPRSAEEELPKGLTFFEVCPDEQKVLVGGVDGEVSVLTLATGEVAVWQKAGDYNLMGAPVWRNAEEITYARRNPLVAGKPPERYAEIVRRRAAPGPGDQEVVLSRDWSKETLESVFGPSDRK
ncbi:MAG TPA: hypothetical protein VMD31_16740 [Opitutaceae bacterium]|nr:hypothetical protein [Opitutaceae bacterium]